MPNRNSADPQAAELAHAWWFVFFAAFYAVLFLPFALDESLPGNCDSWFSPIYQEHLYALVRSWLTGAPLGVSLYPAGSLFDFGESVPGVWALLVALRATGMETTTVHYVLLVLIFSGTAWAVYRLARSYLGETWPAVFAGFSFTCSTFMFANIDDSMLLFFAFPALALLHAKEYVEQRRARSLLAVALYGGVQIYFSVYVFVYQSILLTCFLACRLAELRRSDAARIALAMLIYLAVALPCIGFYMRAHRSGEVANPYDMGVPISTSLHPSDLLRVMPRNLLYETRAPEDAYGPDWALRRRRAFLGWGASGLALLGVLVAGRTRRELLIYVACGVVLALGPYVTWGGDRHETPLHWLMTHVPLVAYLRVPLRAFLLCSLALSIFAGFGLRALLARFSRHGAKLAAASTSALLAMHAIEHVPHPLDAYAVGTLLHPEALYTSFFADKDVGVVLELPSQEGSSSLNSDLPLYAYSRELVYMTWQPQHRQNIVNGNSGYLPHKRLWVDATVRRLPSTEAMRELATFGVQYVVWHPRLLLPGEQDIGPQLRASPDLQVLAEDASVAIYRLAPR